MAQKLYIRRGGGASTETEVTNLAVRKGAPIFEGDVPMIDMGRAARDGEASQGTFRLLDPDAEIHSTTYRLSPHALVTWTEDASGDELWLARSRIAPLASGRRAINVGGDEVEWEVTANDNNIDLRLQPFTEPWVRPAETDTARLIALQAYTLNGSSSTAAHSRSSSNITCSTSHLMTTAFDRTMPAYTYPVGTEPQQVMADCAERSGKTYAVVIHHTGGSHECLLYVGALDHATYVTDVKVSDKIADWDPGHATAPVFEPIWDRGKGTLTENDEVWSGVIVIYGGTNGNPQSVFVHDPADEAPYEYAVGVVQADDKINTEDEATNLADQIFTAHRAPGHRTHRFSILMRASQHHLITAGMSMQVKSAVIAGGADLGTYVWRRITELRWEPHPDPDYLWARIDLEKPLRRRGSSVQPTATTPKPPDTGSPGTPPIAPTVDYAWNFETDLYEDGGGHLYNWDNGSRNSAGSWGMSFATWFNIAGGSGSKVTVPVTNGVDYTVRFDAARWRSTDGGVFRISWDGGHVWETLLTGFVTGSPTSYNFTRTAQSAALTLQMKSNVGGKVGIDAVSIAHGGSGGTAGTPSSDGPTTVGGTGDGSYTNSDKYVPKGSVLELQYIDHGGPYIYAGGISYDASESGLSASDVQAAIDELAARVGVDQGADQITAAPEGGWGRVTKRNVISYGDHTAIAYVKGNNGDTRVTVVANSDPFTVLNTVTLHAALEVDDHAVASLLKRSSDGKLLTAYCAHSATNIYTRLSTNSLDSDPTFSGGFAAEVSRDAVLGGSSYTFAHLYEMTTLGEIWLIYREGANAEWFLSTSTDDGATFGSPTKILTESGQTPYMKAVQNGADRLDLVINERNPSGGGASIWHVYYEAGAWHQSDGTTKTLPINSSKATLVADGSAGNLSFLDIAIGTDGNPVIAFADIDDVDHHAYYWTRWDGVTWSVPSTIVADAGAGIDTATKTYSPHLALDGDNPTVAYVSREVGGQDEMYRTTTADGSSWTPVALTSGSSAKNIRPMSWQDHPDTLAAVWIVGTYTGFTTWSTGIWGAGSTSESVGPISHDDLIDVTPDQHHTEDHAARHADGGADELLIDDLGTSETDTTKRLAPDGAGGVVFAATSSSGTDQHILLADGHATPFTFDDLLQMDDGSDFLWSDPE